MIFVFLALVFLVLYGLHFAIYKTLMGFFHISYPGLKMFLKIWIGLMPLGFVAAAAIAHRFDGHLIRWFYIIFSAWIGVAANLLMFFILAWVFILCASMFSWHPSRSLIGALAIIFALSFSWFGIWNAFNPQIRVVPVKIKNLPDYWQNKTAIQLSDIHLGYAFGPEFLDKVIKQASDYEPEIMFLTGDIFDGVGTDLSEHVAPFNNIHPPSGIHFISGNHETYLGEAKAVKALEDLSINILNDKITRIKGMQVAGLPYLPDRRETSVRLENLLSRLNFEEPAIFLSHLPSYIEEAKKYGVDLQLSGHTHAGQLFPFGYITRMIFGPYHSGFTREGGFAIYTSPGTGAWGPPMRTGNRPEITVIRFLKDE